MSLKLISHTWFRYLLATITVILITAVVALLFKVFSNTRTAIYVAAVSIIALTYLVNKFYVFKVSRRGYTNNFVQLLYVILIFIFDELIILVILGLLPDSIFLVSTLLCVLITSIINYFLLRRVFKIIVRTSFKDMFRSTPKKLVIKSIVFNLSLLIPIILFSIGLLQSGQKIIPGDPDYYFQIHEAFRRSVLEFHQLPFWNGWVGGGIPLFANIQFGLVSVQTPFILLFGTVFGTKIAIVAYQIIAFFGFKKLFKSGFRSSPIKATLLAYIPVFGSFFVDRIVAGHFTFLLIAFVPWLIVFFINRNKKLSWLYFAITYSLMVWSSPHYITIMALLVIGIWFLYQTMYNLILIKKGAGFDKFKQDLKFDITYFIKVGIIAFIFCFYRIFFVVDFIKDFPRPTGSIHENFTGIFTGLYAIWGPDQYMSPPKLSSGWGWAEAATYIGIGTFVCLMIIFGVFIYNSIRRRNIFSYPPILLGALFFTFFILGMGNFGVISPYFILSHLPIFDSMRVATRWLMWASLFALFIIAAYKGRAFSKIINVLLLLTVIELFSSGSHALATSYFLNTQQYRPPTSSFDQVYKYNTPRINYITDKNYLTNYSYDENLYETTRNNLGQVISGDSLIDTRQPNTTIRCGENQGNCNYISNNARVSYWSPNKIIIERIADGPITINSNPGKGWLVNGVYDFSNDKITDPLQSIVIKDSSKKIILEYAPKLSPLWLKTTLKNQI